GIFSVRIPIFLGRVGEWVRPPTHLEHEHVRPVVNTVYELVIAAGGEAADPAVPDLYDTAIWQTLVGQPPLPLAPKSMTSIGRMLLTLDDKSAKWLDLSNEQK